ncbi:FAD:protein FMN transferase [Cerasicoccus maritimus]|uniref:FAD:protein FMN transferase n=1 Tax=Cerasicoccus maritimus TaxID=490089 RepID=UPI00285279ED|nr:FAD:protein FMN transferase [Cerasicoccus maritimus]
MQERSLATSGGYGTYFDAAQRFHHLLDPRTGKPGMGCASVSVLAPTALRADALSTGFCLMLPAVVESLARRDASLDVLVQG